MNSSRNRMTECVGSTLRQGPPGKPGKSRVAAAALAALTALGAAGLVAAAEPVAPAAPPAAVAPPSAGVDGIQVNVSGVAATEALLNSGVRAVTPLHTQLAEENRRRAEMIAALNSHDADKVAKAVSEVRPAMERAAESWLTEVHQPINRFRLEIAGKKSELRSLLAAGGVVEEMEKQRQGELRAQADEVVDARDRLKEAEAGGDPDEIADARFELILAARSHAQQEKTAPVQIGEEAKRQLAAQLVALDELDARFRRMAAQSKTTYTQLRGRLREVRLIETVDLPIQQHALDIRAINRVLPGEEPAPPALFDKELAAARDGFRSQGRAAGAVGEAAGSRPADAPFSNDELQDAMKRADRIESERSGRAVPATPVAAPPQMVKSGEGAASR